MSSYMKSSAAGISPRSTRKTGFRMWFSLRCRASVPELVHAFLFIGNMTNRSVIITKGTNNRMENKFRRKVSQIHGAFITVLGLVLAIYISSVRYTGFGVYGFLQEDSFALGGLMESCLLMCLLGLTLWFGSQQNNSGLWNWIGACAHIPPLLATAMYFSSLA